MYVSDQLLHFFRFVIEKRSISFPFFASLRFGWLWGAPRVYTKGERMKGMNGRIQAAKFGVVMAVIAAAGLASADPLKPSMATQVKLGQQAAAELRKNKKVKILPDTDPKVIELRRIAKNLTSQIPADELKKTGFVYSFDVIDSKDVNAFALPGGPIFFYSGMLDKLKTEDQIAGIVGHEMIHVRNEHWARQYADESKRQIGLAILLGVTRANRDISNIAGMANQVFGSLKYSRSHESESDRLGYDLMVNAGYNPTGMAEVFAMIAKLGSGAPEVLSSHPDPAKRSAVILQRVKDHKGIFPAQRLRGDLKQVQIAQGPNKAFPGPVDWHTDGWATLNLVNIAP
jgi:beta-barrel assembly-enhancing protease